MDEHPRPKQVIVLRKFKGLRTGKYCAQAAHASLAAILSAGALTSTENGARFVLETSDPILASWLLGQFTKICVYVETEEELLALHTSAQKAGLLNSLIQDAGYTEFHGVATYTALAIGPGDLQKIKELTGHLPLL